MAKLSATERAARLAQKIAAEVERGASKGLEAGMRFIVARVKEEASVKAKTKTSKKTGRKYAVERAIPGAPMRVVTGLFRQKITGQMEGKFKAVVGSKARSEKGFDYPRYHSIVTAEYVMSGQHKTFQPVFYRFKVQLGIIIGKEVKIALSK